MIRNKSREAFRNFFKALPNIPINLVETSMSKSGEYRIIPGKDISEFRFLVGPEVEGGLHLLAVNLESPGRLDLVLSPDMFRYIFPEEEARQFGKPATVLDDGYFKQFWSVMSTEYIVYQSEMN